jgi:hypothetical protein
MTKERTPHNRRRVIRKRSARADNEQQEAIPHPAAAIQRARQNPQTLSPSDVLQLQQTLGNRATARLLQQQRQPLPISRKQGTAVQRKIKWHKGPRTKNVNLVNTVTQFLDFGITPLIVNQDEFPGTGNAQTALAGPQFQFIPRGGTKVNLKVQSEPANLIGYRMELPAPAPWQGNVPKAQAASAVEMMSKNKLDDKLSHYHDLSGDTLLKVKGLPNDKQFAKLVEIHEDHHVQEVRDGIKEILEPWDSKIHEFKRKKHTIEGEDQQTAVEGFYSLMGGTPAEIGKEFVDDQANKGNAFHKTAEGSSPLVEDVNVTADGRLLEAYFKHPLG